MPTTKPYLQKGRSGRYEIRYSERMPDGRWRSRTVSTRTSDFRRAQAFLQFWEEEQARVEATLGEADQTPTVGDLVDAYLRDTSGRRASRVQESRLKQARKFLDGLPVTQVTQKTVDDYLVWATGERGVLSSTAIQEVHAVKTALRHGLKTGRIKPGDLNWFAPPAMPEAQPRELLWLDEAQEARFWAWAVLGDSPPEVIDRLTPFSRLVAIGLDTAARRASIETLTWGQVDLQAGTIDFRAPGRTRTNKRRVVVPIAKRLRPILERAWRERREGCDWVLDSPKSLYDTFVSRVRGTEWEAFRPHGMRRTKATLMARAGVPMWQIAGVLGDRIATVENNYAIHAPGGLRGAVDAARA